jgi:hypothetical protein
MEKAKIYDQHAENKEFLSKIDFFKDKIQFLQNRLDEVTAKNNNKEFLIEVEHFQNQLIIQKNNIDEIRHQVVLDEDRLVKEVAKNEIAVEHRSTTFHQKEKESFEQIEKMFNELNHKMTLFFTKWL